MRQSSADVIDWTKRCIVELIQSVIDDVNKGRIFAYLTRWRDPEELYTRVLYAMFVAPADHLPHIFSGDMPNGFAVMWKKVNETKKPYSSCCHHLSFRIFVLGAKRNPDNAFLRDIPNFVVEFRDGNALMGK
jgi:hypothetical protein